MINRVGHKGTVRAARVAEICLHVSPHQYVRHPRKWDEHRLALLGTVETDPDAEVGSSAPGDGRNVDIGQQHGFALKRGRVLRRIADEQSIDEPSEQPSLLAEVVAGRFPGLNDLSEQYGTKVLSCLGVGKRALMLMSLRSGEQLLIDPIPTNPERDGCPLHRWQV